MTLGGKLLLELKEKKTKEFFDEMRTLGMSECDVKEYVASWQSSGTNE
jgi:hypothetical protein